jgi:dTDP-4-dehydrorhamnose reductase
MPVTDKVLILGGGGMLAHALRSTFAPRAGDLLAPRRGELDITDRVALRETVQRFKPTLVINAAAHTKVDLCEYQRDLARLINGAAPGFAAEAARSVGAALVHFSTDFVFSGDDAAPRKPADPTGPRCEYGHSKLLGEDAVLASHPAALVLRTSWLFGPGGPCFPATILAAARAGKPLSVVADQTGCPTYTLDLARATLTLVEAGLTGLHHFSNSDPTTWHAFAQATLRTFGLANPISPITSADWKSRAPWSAPRPAYSVLDCSSLSPLLTPRPWQATLADYRMAVGE